MNFDIGSTIGDYQIIGILGAGGMGKVYKVRNVISDRVEALKVLLPDLVTEPDLADRFVREIKVQASLEHPNIAALHTALRVDNQLLMLMEFVEGVTLEQRLKQGPLPVAEAVQHIEQVLAALGYAHQHGVIHRDIKPANMMLTGAGTIKLMDFGIAKAATDRRLTMTGTTMGSLYYMSPEQIKGAATLDARSDLYSVGVSLYELVTGKRPFDGDSQFAIMAAHLEKNPVPPLTLDPSLPATLNDLILLSVAKDPAARFQTAEAFRKALGTILEPAPAPKPAPAATPPPPTAKSHRGLWLAAGALFTALLVVALIQFGPWKKTIASQTPPPAPTQQTTPEPVTPVATPIPQEAPPQPVPIPEAKPQTPAAKPPIRAAKPQAPIPSPIPAPQAQAPIPAPQAQAPIPQAQPPANAAPQPPGPSPAELAAHRAQLQQIREQLVMLSSRASGIQQSLNNLQRSQAAGGMSLRGDMSEAASLMRSFLEGAGSALKAGDADSAKGFMDKAERQVEKLEKFLGR